MTDRKTPRVNDKNIANWNISGTLARLDKGSRCHQTNVFRRELEGHKCENCPYGHMGKTSCYESFAADVEDLIDILKIKGVKLT